ncbi:hypothetical protein CSV63_03075 [Sporosarcina sp. P34]|uniref:hypothetical protein n=1 Tax=Sporosarcina sp. P34 TaxID=2048247 RepID=UPI000C17199F|nr:hypothetical protein [Sporosarcina sp. P34]PID16888.1 hypothetical protein CSV63_03075 [Sporosarcina sp. P34]
MTNLSEIHLQPYIKEILTNAHWALSLIEQGDKFSIVDYEKVKYYSLAVNTADLVGQLACFTTARSGKNKTQAVERLRALENSYPGIPQPPDSAKSIRNTIHHFDERMDDWIFEQLKVNDGSYAYVTDSAGNLEGFASKDLNGKPFNFERRMLDANEFLYWDEIIKIDELKKWCEEIVSHFSQVNPR